MNEVHRRLQVDPTFARKVAIYVELIRSGELPAELISAIVQVPQGIDSIDVYDGFVVGYVCSMISAGDLLWFGVRTSGVPDRDTEQTANQRILEQLTVPFSATFFGGYADFDGVFEISCSRDGTTRIQYPLEVGFTKSATTFQHLLRRNGLARWPHESSAIQVLAFPPLKSDLACGIITE